KVVLKGKEVAVDLVDAMIIAADDSFSDQEVQTIGSIGLPNLRVVLGNVHGQFDELSDRGARPVAARQWLGACHSRRSQTAVSGSGAHNRRHHAALLRTG